MKIIAVDDESDNLEAFALEAEGLDLAELAGMFTSPREALEFVEKTPVDLAVLDVEMPEMDGISLGRKLKERCPGIALIYVTGHTQYAFDAFQLEASAYLLKPFNQADIERAIARAKALAESEEKLQSRKKLFIRTFGRFEVFVDGNVVEFPSSKAKELLALLVDRKGGIVTTQEMLTYLWEDRPDSDASRSLCRKVASRLHKCLEQIGADDIIIRHKRGRSLDTEKVECDLYRYLEGKKDGKETFCGEYMTNYSWAEETLGMLLTLPH